jgi:hypothetical protein
MTKPPTWVWIVAVVALLWALAGCAAYLMQVTMTPADIAKLPPAQAELMAIMPAWLNGVYAIAVWIGLAGAVALLLRRRIARALYIVSLVAVVVQFGWIFTMTPIFASMGFLEAAGFPIFVGVAGLALIWFAGRATQRGWLR